MLKQKIPSKRRLGIFNILVLILNGIFIIAMLLSYLSVHISPEKSWLLPFFGLGYPILLIINLFFMLYWILRKRWLFIASAVVILAGWNHLGRTFQVGLNPERQASRNGFSIISYNVKNMSNDNINLVEPEIREKIIGFLVSDSSDIVCLQEFVVIHRDPEAFIDSVSSLLGLPYHAHAFYKTKRTKYVDAISVFSRYPIINSNPIMRDHEYNYGIMADLLIGRDTVRLFNMHLESVRLRHEDYSFITGLDLQFEKDEKIQEGSLRIIKKLKSAFMRRARQVGYLTEAIKDSPYPVILCGDFNDTPNSYTYQQLTRLLTDSFKESGSGFGNTYIGKLPSFRIDYILHDDYFISSDYQRKTISLSDHYPVSCRLMPQEPRKP